MDGYRLFRKGRLKAVQEVLEHTGNFLTKMPEEGKCFAGPHISSVGNWSGLLRLRAALAAYKR